MNIRQHNKQVMSDFERKKRLNNIISIIIIGILINILGFIFFESLDKSYVNRVKAARYYQGE